MRINKFIATATGLSRRAADSAIEAGSVLINGEKAQPGQTVQPEDEVRLDHRIVNAPGQTQTILLNKPVGYIVSREGQGNKTVYDLLPPELHHLKPVGRLDKDSSGLLILTNDGQLAQELTHPKYQKTKMYEIELDKPLTAQDKNKIEHGVEVEDYISRLRLTQAGNSWLVAMSEGRNRQIRRTFAALGYTVRKLHRTQVGPFNLSQVPTPGSHYRLKG